MLVFAFILVATAGLGFYAALRRHSESDVFEATGLSLLLGCAVISAALLAFAPFAKGPALIGSVSLVALGSGMFGVSQIRRINWRSIAYSHLFVLLLALATTIVGWQALAQPLAADGLFNFEVRARLAWENGGAIPQEFFSDISRNWMHQSYPLFVSLNELWLYLWLGSADQVFAKILGIVWFLASACLTFSQLTRLTNESWRGMVAVGLLLVVPAAVFYPGGAVWAWGDFPLAAVFVCAALYALEYRTRKTGAACFAATVAALPWIKREGVILGLALLAYFGWGAIRRREWKIVLAAFAPFAVVTFGWRIFTIRTGTPVMTDFASPSASLLVQNFDRLPRIVVIALRELLVWQRWSLLWPLTFLAGFRIAREQNLIPWRPLFFIVLILIAAYSGIYFFSVWPSLLQHMLSSLPRVLLPPAMLAISLVAVAFPGSKQPPAANTPNRSTANV